MTRFSSGWYHNREDALLGLLYVWHREIEIRPVENPAVADMEEVVINVCSPSSLKDSEPSVYAL